MHKRNARGGYFKYSYVVVVVVVVVLGGFIVFFCLFVFLFFAVFSHKFNPNRISSISSFQ